LFGRRLCNGYNFRSIPHYDTYFDCTKTVTMVLHATDFIRGRESFDAAQALARYDVDIDGSIYADSDTAVSL
jgi:hypothetical protein